MIIKMNNINDKASIDHANVRSFVIVLILLLSDCRLRPLLLFLSDGCHFEFVFERSMIDADEIDDELIDGK